MEVVVFVAGLPLPVMGGSAVVHLTVVLLVGCDVVVSVATIVSFGYLAVFRC